MRITEIIIEAEKKTMSRAAKGNKKYGKDGMKALAKAGREGAGEEKLDSIRDKYDKYDIEEASGGVAGPKNCWPGYRKTGTQPGTGKNTGKRVNDCEKIKEGTGDSPVADALIQHILRHRPDLLNHGADLVGDAIDEIASRVGNRIPNIGPREMNNWVNQIEQFVKRGGSDGMMEDWQKVNKSDKTDGMSSKAVKSYRRENPGSKLKTAVTTKPSKLKKGSKAANRRKSFCARMGGMKKSRASAKTKRDPNSPINKALRRWNCESVEQLHQLVMIAEQKIRNLKK